uniref:Putative ovule protein n=1 Tax=Solanum chacoense TaxID=4108 RepID=A0A0V0H2S0_SOLCH
MQLIKLSCEHSLAIRMSLHTEQGEILHLDSFNPCYYFQLKSQQPLIVSLYNQSITNITFLLQREQSLFTIVFDLFHE